MWVKTTNTNSPFFRITDEGVKFHYMIHMSKMLFRPLKPEPELLLMKETPVGSLVLTNKDDFSDFGYFIVTTNKQTIKTADDKRIPVGRYLVDIISGEITAAPASQEVVLLGRFTKSQDEASGDYFEITTAVGGEIRGQLD